MNSHDEENDELEYEVDRVMTVHRQGDRVVQSLNEGALDPADWPESWRTYERKAYPRFPIEPLPNSSSGIRRNSVRTFSPLELDRSTIGSILSSVQMIGPEGSPARSVPSAGALYPIETYVLEVSGEENRCSYYDAEAHALVDLFPLPKEFVDSPNEWLGVSPTPNVAAYIVLSAVLYRSMRKYGARGYRYALMEAGAIGGAIDNAVLDAGLGSVWLGGFDDQKLSDLIGVRPDIEMEVPLVAIAIGGR